ncbi:MAG: hypothetical protein N2036_09225 [Bryobacteraceae bacterium]|nr:hypothetical protein [Bryobacteraceae bacterium]
MKSWAAILFASTVLAAPPPPLTMDDVRREGDPLRRFEKAIRLAEMRLADAWKLVREQGPVGEFEGKVNEIVDAARLALESLESTGKRPSRLSRQYKRGELRTRALERGLKELGVAVGFEERVFVEKAREQLAGIHEKFLHGVMSK